MVAAVLLCPDGRCSWSCTLDRILEKGGGGLTQLVLRLNTSGIIFCDREKIKEGEKEECQGKK